MKYDYEIKFGRKRRVSAKHLKKQNELLRLLALNGALSKFELSRKSGKSLIGLKASDPKLIKKEKFHWSLVYKLINELEEKGKIRKYGKVKREKQITTVYGLTFFGFLWFFTLEKTKPKDMEQAIKKYSEMHILFKYWEEIKKTIIGKRSNDIYDVLRYASDGTLGFLEKINDVTFEKPIFILDEESVLEAFAMNFLRYLKIVETEYRGVSIEEISVPELYDYLKKIVEERKKEFEDLEKLIQKYK